MGTALITIKIMPDSPEADLNAINQIAQEKIKESTESDIKIEEEPIAFGLKALIIRFALDESLSVDEVQNKLKEIEHVNSAEVIDFRRALG